MLRVGSRLASAICGGLLPVAAVCAESEMGRKQSARNPSLAFTGNLLVDQWWCWRAGPMVIPGGHGRRRQQAICPQLRTVQSWASAAPSGDAGLVHVFRPNADENP